MKILSCDPPMHGSNKVPVFLDIFVRLPLTLSGVFSFP